MILKWSEMAWWLDDPRVLFSRDIIGEAGNGSYGESSQVSAMRIGEQVLIDSPVAWPIERRSRTIPANTVVQGFGEGFDGRTLANIMEEGVHYNYALRPMN